jgi:hypothetical protein
VKTKIPKRHLKESDAPLLPGTDQIAMCGEIVPRAGFPFMYDDSLTYHFAEFLTSLHVCETCWKTELAIATFASSGATPPRRSASATCTGWRLVKRRWTPSASICC